MHRSFVMVVSARRPAFKHPAWRWLAFIVAAVVLCLLLAWLAVPPLAKHLLQTQGAQWLGRPVSVASVDFKPWSLELTLKDLSIAAQAPGSQADAQPQPAPQFHLDRLYVNLSAQSLLRLAPVVDALVLDAPQLKVRRLAGGGYDIDDILQKFSSDPAQPAPERSEPPAFALYNVQVNQGHAELDDEVTGVHHVLDDLTLALPFLSTLKSQREVTVQPQLTFLLNGSRFASTAQSLPFTDSRKTSANLQVQALDLSPYLTYLPKDTPARLTAGHLSLDLQWTFEQAEAPQLHVAGRANLQGLAVADAAGQPLLALDQATVDLADVAPLARQVRLSAVALQGVRGTLARRADGSLALMNTAAPQESTSPSPTPPAETPWQVAVERVQLDGGELRWVDDAVKPQARSG
ncbi:MAG: hypothetical protein GAK30_02991 [Paracidovorax wautersii]|uniref:DUF748 domain-containing protein n=1 Tax=Paracidovorax wautersii TaxID=1177982 RepID=A0A7V8FM21_9BURK|nr:MAG: hypothetical protein GAK30_02991 [Paracidovorax wautersii]